MQAKVVEAKHKVQTIQDAMHGKFIVSTCSTSSFASPSFSSPPFLFLLSVYFSLSMTCLRALYNHTDSTSWKASSTSSSLLPAPSLPAAAAHKPTPAPLQKLPILSLSPPLPTHSSPRNRSTASCSTTCLS